MIDTDCLIIGAGVVGLAVAEQLSSQMSCIVVERHSSFGWETSSRNSEVIHAGLYYPQNSLKAKLCIEGNKLLYEFCEKYKILHRKCGKLVISINECENQKLHNIFENAKLNGVDNIEYVTNDFLQLNEPNIAAFAAFISRNTGILDTHSFMQCLEALAINNGAIFSYNTEVISIEKHYDFFKISLKTNDEQIISIRASIVINSAGLDSDSIAQMIGIQDENLTLNFTKGNYFKLNSSKFKFSHLVYPVPDDMHSLGIHLTIDLNGGAKLGPDVEFLDDKIVNYNVEEKLKEKFFKAGKRYIKNLSIADLSVDYSGIRPKLQKKTESFRDFYIKNETERNLNGFINLIGIESPGLTASLAIAKYVANIL